MRDRTLIALFVLPLIVAGSFAGFRLATRRPAPPLPPEPIESVIRRAAEMTAEARLGRKLTEEERGMIRVEGTPGGGHAATYDEPLFSRIPSSRPATRP
jgi:hypothetical protein